MKDKTGKYIRIESVTNDKNWLYQKYVIERLSWDTFYEKYNISPTLLQSRLKEFNIKRKRFSWNKNKTKQTDKRLDYVRPTQFKSYGKCAFKELLRKSTRYKQWIKNILERDNYTCLVCGKRGIKLDIHHIKPLSLIIEENGITNIEDSIDCHELWDIDNGQTLCKCCHKETDTYLTRWVADVYYKQSALAFGVPA